MGFGTSFDFYKKLLWIALLLGYGLSGQAQEQRFGAAVVAGLTASQLNGDQSAGYNKVGFTAGIRGITRFNDKLNLAVEILFSQRGSRYPTGINNPTPGAPLNIQTTYIDVPVVLNISDWLSDDQTFYRIHLRGGLAFGRLFNAVATDSPYDQDTDLFEDNDFYFLLGVAFNVNPNLAFTFRYNRSIVLLFNNRNHLNFNANSLLSHFLTLRAEYEF